MITSSSPAKQPSTRERLLREGLRLFASRGFAGTTVGDIEAAAGLKPRRGALYRHFPSKHALLEAAVARHNTTASDAAGLFANLPVTDPRAAALVVGRWLLADLDAQRDMTHILERDGERLPGLRDEFRSGSETGFSVASKVIAEGARTNENRVDGDPFGVLLLGALINFRRSTWTLGAPPLGLSDERLLAAFADLFATLIEKQPPPK